MNKFRFRVYKYKDGTQITEEHFEPMDGKWKYGDDVYKKIFNLNYNFYE